MKQITEFCTGCRACEQLCAKKAISMVADKEGFLTAKVDSDKCVDCRLCQKICPQNKFLARYAPKKVLAVRLKDDEVLFRSASGSAFGGIAEAWIKDGGVVFGVVYDKYWNAHYVCASTFEELQPILSSKYVQADTRFSYSEVKRLLEDGKQVLFSGTGCQIGGLRAFLRKKYDNLLTMDLICHGVPSPQLFREYIAWLEEKNASQIKFYDFRDKRGGWGLAFKYVSKEHKYFKPCSIDPYYSYFLEGYTYRECCYKCRYCRPERTGDITIGDFWGIENEHPDFYSIKGVSCMLINTNKGLVTWRKYRYLYHSIESTFEKVSRENSNLLHPTERKNAIRDHIYDGIGTKDWFANVFASSFKPSNKSKKKAQIPIKFRFWMKWLLELIRFRSMRLHMRI